MPWSEVVGISPLPMCSNSGGPIVKALAGAAHQLDSRPLAVHIEGRPTKRKTLTFSDGRTASGEEVEL